MNIIGEGATSFIYLENINNTVIKKPNYDLSWCPDELIDDIKKDIKESFQREIMFFKSVISYKYIIKCLKIEDNDNIILEYVENGSIYEYIKNNNGKDKWIYQICDALLFIHNNSFIHGDLNTQNILLDNEYNIKLCDFGKSKKINESALSSSIGYQSPELINQTTKSAEKCDIYSLGVVIWSIINNKEPYIETENVSDYNEKILNGWTLPLSGSKYDSIILEMWKPENIRPSIKIIIEKMNNLLL